MITSPITEANECNNKISHIYELHTILMKTLQAIIILLFSGTLLAQSPKYTIEVKYNLYATDFDNKEHLYESSIITITNPNKVNQLISELKNTKSIDHLLVETKIDTTAIHQNPKQLIKYYDNKFIGWNAQQIDYISEKLSHIETYKEYFASYLELGCCVGMHQRDREEYIIKVFENDILTDTYTSRKSLPNTSKVPWTNTNNTQNYNISVDKIFFDLIGSKKSYKQLIRGKELTKYLVTKIIDEHQRTLYELSAYDYFDELNELKTDFEILNIGEVYGRGRYIWNAPKTYYARLKNTSMLPQVNIMFLASKSRKSIYSRDSIKSDYKDIIKRVQGIDFLIEHIHKNSSTKLDIYYFNNKPINDYNIDNFNKNHEEWSKHDKFLESIKKFENEETKPAYANQDAIRINKEIYCGCNYRFKKDFAEKAVFIELNNKETKENSVWYLLPNNTVLLYIMQGNKVLDYEYTKFGKFKGIQYPCVLFDLKGNIIDRK